MADLFPKLYGNARLKSILARDLYNGKSAHAYIISGPSGSGKHTVAYEAAAAISCIGEKSEKAPFPCGSCIHCLKISRGVAPDLHIISRGDKASIGVETIREMKLELYTTPNEAKAKVYIIEEADTMTPQAQNALLLSLEEPPPFVVFFLLTENPEALLETIRSRAPILRTEIFSPDVIRKYITERGYVNTLSADQLSRMSDASVLGAGTIGKTMELIKATDAEFDKIAVPGRQAKAIFKALCSSSTSDLTALLRDMPKTRDETINLLVLVLDAAKDACSVKKNAGVSTCFFSSADECRNAVRSVSFTKICKIAEAVNQAVSDLEKNVSQTTVLSSLFLKKYN